MTNIYVDAPDKSREALIKSLSSDFLVHWRNTSSGFSLHTSVFAEKSLLVLRQWASRRAI